MENVIKTGNELKLLKTTDVQLLNAINIPDPLNDTSKALKDAVAEKQDEYIMLFIKLLNNISSDSSVHFLLEYIKNLCETTAFTEAFASIGSRSSVGSVDPIAPFLALLKKDTKEVVKLNYGVLGALLSVSDFEKQERPINQLVDACIRYLNSSDPDAVASAVNALTYLLRSRAIRDLYTTKNGIPLLTKLIKQNVTDTEQRNVQLIYELGFCIWMLTYNDTSIIVLMKHNAIAQLHEILRCSKKEKCTRVAILALKNFAFLQARQHGYADQGTDFVSVPTVDLEGNKLNIFGDMVGLGLLRTLSLMSRRNYGDADILPEVDALLATLEKNIDETTSFADYKQEVLSGRLAWTPIHKSEKFWKENIKEFERDDYKILRELGNILASSPTDALALTIICHDFGEFVKYHPQGRKIMNTLDVKNRILALIGHDNQEVNKQALLCVQKIMVQKWEFLSA